MPDKQRNSNRNKENQEENRPITIDKADQKETDNPRNLTENVSTADNDDNPGQSRTEIRKEEKEQRE